MRHKLMHILAPTSSLFCAILVLPRDALPARRREAVERRFDSLQLLVYLFIVS